jgi:hypothetical protein
MGREDETLWNSVLCRFNCLRVHGTDETRSCLMPFSPAEPSAWVMCRRLGIGTVRKTVSALGTFARRCCPVCAAFRAVKVGSADRSLPFSECECGEIVKTCESIWVGSN